jgi:uncharacterized membrane protein YbaN (DUF454 family)
VWGEAVAREICQKWMCVGIVPTRMHTDVSLREISHPRRIALLVTGLVSLGTGILGIFIPLLPTTCFLLLAAWCFGKSSPRLHAWMMNNRWFGDYLSDYKAGRGIPRKLKVGSLSMLWVVILASVAFAVSALWVRTLLIVIAVAVTIHVASLRDSRALQPDPTI